MARSFQALAVVAMVMTWLPTVLAWAAESTGAAKPSETAKPTERAEVTGAAKPTEGPGDSTWIGQRLEKAKKEQDKWQETADAVLIRVGETRWTRYSRALLGLPDWMDLGLEQRTRYEHMTNPFRRGEFGTDEQLFLRSRVRFGLNGGPFRFLAELQDARSEFFEPGEFQNNTTVNKNDILQLFVSATSRNFLGTGLRADVHFGRLTLDIGQRRLVARNDFRNTVNAFDGVHFNLAKDKVWQLRAFFVEPVQRFLNSLDEQTNKSVFWGTYLTFTSWPNLNVDVYYLGLNDQQNGTPSNHRTLNTYGVRPFKLPKVGEVDYEIESAWQTGRVGTREQFAHMQHAEVGYTFNVQWAPRVVAQYDYASGDSNPNDGYSQRFDQLFGARRFDLMPTGIFGPFFRTNINSPGMRLVFQPHAATRYTIKYRAWYLAQGEDQWVGSSFGPQNFGTNFLGQDIELRLQWTVNRNLDFDFGYDHLFKGSYIEATAQLPGAPPTPAGDTDYFYVQGRVRF